MSFNITEAMHKYWKVRQPIKAKMEDIAKVEAVLMKKLPQPYIEFVINYGFAEFDEGFDGFDYIIKFPDRKEIHQGGIACLDKSERLILRHGIIYQNSPEEGFPLFTKEYFPVGSDAGQGLILLKLEGNNVGSVWYWDYKECAWGIEDNTTLGFVADDFYDFINKLKDYEV